MESTEISFKRPSQTTPLLVVKVRKTPPQKASIFILVLLFGLFTVLSIKTLDYASSVLCGLSFFILLAVYIKILKFCRTLTLMEIFKEGVWFSTYDLFVPKNKFRGLEVDRQSAHSCSATIQRIGAKVLVSDNEYEKLPLNIKLSENNIPAVDGKWHITVMLPFTVGLTDDIGLNLTRSELLGYMNNYTSAEL